MRPIAFFTALVHLTLAATSQRPLFTSQDEYGPNIASATENANLIFNAIHSSMRQWGSSAQHNGMSFFPAYIPEGTLLYHGSTRAERPEHLEWLAFEIPHAEMFARGRIIRRPRNDSRDENEVEAESDVDPRNMSPEQLWSWMMPPGYDILPGYLQIYQANRPLKVLYLDGMSAGKSDRGTLDSQDLLLLNLTGEIWDDRRRGAGLCNLAEKLGVEGFVRMECGFELIKCDFSDGLNFISHKQRPHPNKQEGLDKMFLFEFVRDVASRYHGIGAGRVLLDYSSMVSAFFYPTNLSNPDPDPRQSKLPRLVETDDNVLKQIKSDLQGTVSDSKGTTGIDWQGVTDMIVKRYAPRLRLLSTGLPQARFLSELNTLMNTFIDYSIPGEQDPAEVCSLHFLQPAQPSTEQDHLIAAAFKTVTHKICDTLFEIRTMLLQKDDNTTDSNDTNVEVQMIRDLNVWLDWSDWISCGQCAVDEVCFIAFFPFGTEEDHYNPQCRNSTEMDSGRRRFGDSYWQPRRK